jgi:hypothetical protein
MYLLHLGSHCLDAAQNLILVCDGCDANSCQVTEQRRAERAKKKSRGLKIFFQASCTHTHLNQPQLIQHNKAGVLICLIKQFNATM